MSDLFLSIGGNLGDRALILSECKKNIESRVGKIHKESSIYVSEAWGFSHPRDFYNQVLWIKTQKNPNDTLDIVLNIELEMGRQRSKHKEQAYEGRLIDIDIIIFNNDIIKNENLQVPHPHMHKRNFVMFPMAEIAPLLIHPIINQTMLEIKNTCIDNGKIKILHYE